MPKVRTNENSVNSTKIPKYKKQKNIITQKHKTQNKKIQRVRTNKNSVNNTRSKNTKKSKKT